MEAGSWAIVGTLAMGPRSRARWRQARTTRHSARPARRNSGPLCPREWIIEIEDISAFVEEQREHAHGDYTNLVVPQERVYPYPQTTRGNSIPIFTSLLKIGLFITLRFAVRSILHLLSLCCNVSFTTIQHCRKLICFAAHKLDTKR